MNKILSTLLLLSIFGSFQACKKSPHTRNNESYNGRSYHEANVKYDKIEEATEDFEGDYNALKEENTGFGDRMLIKNGFLEIETASLEKSRNEVMQLLKNFKGAYISEERIENFPFRESNTLTLRIPSKFFDTFIQALIQSEGRVVQKNISTEDVTEEYLDVNARIKAKKELESRYLELLKKAVKVEELLQIEREIGTLRADIESYEGRLNYLKQQISFSTITLTYNQFTRENKGFSGKIGQELYKGWNSFLGGLLGLIGAWPYVIILVFIFLIWRKRHKRLRN
jgi:hypothetical protein